SHSSYVVHFGNAAIHTAFTSDSGDVTTWLDGIGDSAGAVGRVIVGLDIEWRPHNSQYYNPAATLQICVGDNCLIFQLLHADRIPPSLIDFMSSRRNIFVGVGIESDLGMLQSDYNFGFGVNWKDLRTLAADKYGMEDLKRSGLKRLANMILNIDMEKPEDVTRSRWDDQYLSGDQIKYAAVDAYACFEIGRALIAS
ncbi:hypothetical protein M569_15090, partial [Genlisea aurea]